MEDTSPHFARSTLPAEYSHSTAVSSGITTNATATHTRQLLSIHRMGCTPDHTPPACLDQPFFAAFFAVFLTTFVAAFLAAGLSAFAGPRGLPIAARAAS